MPLRDDYPAHPPSLRVVSLRRTGVRAVAIAASSCYRPALGRAWQPMTNVRERPSVGFHC
jgi:hypothetical protein